MEPACRSPCSRRRVFGDFADQILQSLQNFVEELRAPQLAPGAALVAAASGAKETKRDRVLATGLDVFEAMSPANCKRVMELATLVLNKADQPWGDSGAFLATTRVRDLAGFRIVDARWPAFGRPYHLTEGSSSRVLREAARDSGASASCFPPPPLSSLLRQHHTDFWPLWRTAFLVCPLFAASKTLALFPPPLLSLLCF